jgi:phosphoribosylaminoimidazolecarboxamide formyltransferase/IMP cyclohydrolase
MPRALLSVSDKTGIVELGRGLVARGFELLSTGGTARTLTEAGLPVTNVSDITGFPEMMDGRVKTLHPKIHGGLLARRDHPADLDAARAHGIGLIDLVVVNLYPFAATAARSGVTFEEVVEQVDIGGPSMIRAAAKNFRDVLVVVDPERYGELLVQLDAEGGPSLAFRFELARGAIHHTGTYDVAIWNELLRYAVVDGRFAREPGRTDEAPNDMSVHLHKLRDLRYGENPHQKAALYGGFSERFQPWAILQGKELSYTNLLDLDAAVRIALEFSEPAAVVVKHTNPCGAATGASGADAYVRARDADSIAAFGGIVALNRPIDLASASAITSTFIEAVIAPSVEDAARPLLGKKPNMRVVTADFAALAADHPGPAGEELRSTLAGVLVQQRDRVIEARAPWSADTLPDGMRVVTTRQPTPDEWAALRFAWRICAHVKSNTVIFTDAQRTLAIGAGQMSRVDAVNVAVMKAGAGTLRGSVAASDAFFPFRDGLDAAAAAGATAIVQPGGSKRDDEVIAAANEHGLAMVFSGTRHFRH